MPLRDHFRPPVSARASWDSLHGFWPAAISTRLFPHLPDNFVAAPTIHLGRDIEIDLDSPDVYEVRIYDPDRDRVLVAAIEIVSPSNKDRPDHRTDFVGKCLSLLRSGVCVSIVDLVTPHHFNLYADLLGTIGHGDPLFADTPAHVYAATLRYARRDGVGYLETWSHPLVLGQALPTLPVWLSPTFAVPLELETSYEDVCRLLRVR